MATANIDEITKPSKSFDDEETNEGQTGGANSSSLAERGDMVWVSSDHLIVLC
jgi:hypothetical protein